MTGPTEIVPVRDRVWSAALAGVAIVRASSYIERPPATITEATIFTILPPLVWAVVLMIIALILLVGAARPDPRLIVIGSGAGLIAYLIFAWNFAGYVAADPALGWAGIGLIFLGCGVFFERIWNLGWSVRRWRPGDEVT